jgi:hypothetical protein
VPTPQPEAAYLRKILKRHRNTTSDLAPDLARAKPPPRQCPEAVRKLCVEIVRETYLLDSFEPGRRNMPPRTNIRLTRAGLRSTKRSTKGKVSTVQGVLARSVSPEEPGTVEVSDPAAAWAARTVAD